MDLQTALIWDAIGFPGNRHCSISLACFHLAIYRPRSLAESSVDLALLSLIPVITVFLVVTNENQPLDVEPCGIGESRCL